MKNKVALLLLVTLTVFFVTDMKGQGTPASSYWKDVTKNDFPKSGELNTKAKKYRLVQLDRSALDKNLENAPMINTDAANNSTSIIEIPMPDNTFVKVKVVEKPRMPQSLRKRYPNIKSYIGEGIEDKTLRAAINKNPNGLSIMLTCSKGQFFVEPYQNGDLEHYACYNKKDLPGNQPFETPMSGKQNPKPQTGAGPQKTTPGKAGN